MGILARGTTKHAHVCMKRDRPRHLAFYEGSLGVTRSMRQMYKRKRNNSVPAFPR